VGGPLPCVEGDDLLDWPASSLAKASPGVLGDRKEGHLGDRVRYAKELAYFSFVHEVESCEHGAVTAAAERELEAPHGWHDGAVETGTLLGRRVGAQGLEQARNHEHRNLGEVVGEVVGRVNDPG
jgi:hypothetical protein